MYTFSVYPLLFSLNSDVELKNFSLIKIHFDKMFIKKRRDLLILDAGLISCISQSHYVIMRLPKAWIVNIKGPYTINNT